MSARTHAVRTHAFRTHAVVVDAALRREIAEHRLNRFLHVHLTLCAVIGLLPLFTPDAAERSAPAWVLQGVLYCLSLSSLLLGLSAAHGDADEFPLLFTQPIGHGAWLTGKLAALVAMLVPASALAGGAFLVLADTLARWVLAPIELPVGALTALVGGPLFLVLLRRDLARLPS